MSEYKIIVNKYRQVLKDDSISFSNEMMSIRESNQKTFPKFSRKEFRYSISSSDKERLATIFFQMNKEQQEKQIVRFYLEDPKSKIVPTKEQLESFKDQNTYIISINNDEVSNEVLNNYTNIDFAYVSVGKDKTNVEVNGRSVYGVHLLTNGYFQSYNNMAIARKIFTMGVMYKDWGGYWSMENLEKAENK